MLIQLTYESNHRSNGIDFRTIRLISNPSPSIYTCGFGFKRRYTKSVDIVAIVIPVILRVGQVNF